MESAAGGGGPLSMMVMFALIFGVFYFLVIMPAKKQQKKKEAMIAALKKGDKVVTSGGIFGTISTFAESTIRISAVSFLTAKAVICKMYSNTSSPCGFVLTITGTSAV